ncbi:MAG: hypothetical protein WD208_03025 [Dehalococcoidia bacterium]
MSQNSSDIDSSTLEERALERLRGNVRSGYDRFYKRHYAYSAPSPGRYIWQWFWDACFHAVALSRLDTEMAKKELRDLIAPQRKDGFIGHITYWGWSGAVMSAVFMQGRLGEWRRRHSAMIQPPLLAQAIEAVHAHSGDQSFLTEMLPKAQAYYDWLARERDAAGDGLISIISPWESGLDNSPAFDEPLGLSNPSRMKVLLALRKLDWFNMLRGGNFDFRTIVRRDRFVVIEPMVNAIYADGLRSLARLHLAAGDETASLAADARAARVEASLNEHCWDQERGQYVYLWGKDRRPITLLTAPSLFPVILQDTPRERVATVVERHLVNKNEFWTHLPVPSVAASEPTFDPEGESLIWRGPVCMNLNWFLARGLRHHGFNAEADHIVSRSLESVNKNGFREFYSPNLGRGMRGTQFGWATVVVDMVR